MGSSVKNNIIISSAIYVQLGLIIFYKGIHSSFSDLLNYHNNNHAYLDELDEQGAGIVQLDLNTKFDELVEIVK